MNFFSTRDKNAVVTSAQAIMQGLSFEGGLFVPESFPEVNVGDILSLSYEDMASVIIGSFLTDYDSDFLKKTAVDSYKSFNGNTATTVKVSDNVYSLELWHGPTCAFKDYALQIMPRLLVEAKKINGEVGDTYILVATSGDTGKAALDGYKDIEGIKIAVFYPNAGTSEVQRLQMVTQEGDNVKVFAVNGNFDNAQTGVKKAFADKDLAKRLLKNNIKLSSANSINWGRLVPQIVYYFASYANLVNTGAITLGDEINYCVPTGNFGDILAGYYAKMMGLPINKLICASNTNNVLSDFFATGTYKIKNREFHKTSSPSMDILISSNLERLLYHASGDTNYVASLMNDLNTKGEYTVKEEVMDKIRSIFDYGYADDNIVASEIKKVYDEDNYLSDTHTAVAFNVNRKFSSDKVSVIVSTANPFKFPCDVLKALGEDINGDDFKSISDLEKLTGKKAPVSLSSLLEKTVRFNTIINPEDIANVPEKM